MKELTKARIGYKEQSRVEIKIEEDIMGMYRTLIRERAPGIRLPALRELLRSRFDQQSVLFLNIFQGLRPKNDGFEN